MTRRVLSLALSLALLLAAVPALAFNAAPFTSDTDSFFAFDTGSGYLVVSTVYTQNTGILEFDHPFAGQEASLMNNALQLGKGDNGEDTALFALLITLNTSEAIDVSKASIYLNGKEYRFTIFGDSEKNGSEYHQIVTILAGSENFDFMMELLNVELQYLNDFVAAGGKAVAVPDCRIVLHGTEDIEFTVPDGYWTDLAAFGMAFGSLEAEDLSEILMGSYGSPCTVK